MEKQVINAGNPNKSCCYHIYKCQTVAECCALLSSLLPSSEFELRNELRVPLGHFISVTYNNE